MNYKDFFGCKYPIVASSMNQVSNLDLAIACHNAGIFPSLAVYSYSTNNLHVDYKLIDRDLKIFEDKTGSNNLMLSVGVSDCLYDDAFNLIMQHNIKHVELLSDDKDYRRQLKREYVEEYKKSNVKLIPKILMLSHIKLGNISAVILKGKDGAGRGSNDLDNELEKIQNTYPDLPVIASGGISTNSEVKKYLDLGCLAVSVGTILAAAEESPLSVATKQKMVEASYANITRFKNGSDQNALIFKEIKNDDVNHTTSLIQGIKDPSSGHIFAGKGINNVKAIRPLADIVQELVDGL